VQRSCVYPLIRLEARNLRSLKQKISSSCSTRSFSVAVSRKSVEFDGKQTFSTPAEGAQQEFAGIGGGNRENPDRLARHRE
jgi:hypothetical protein